MPGGVADTAVGAQRFVSVPAKFEIALGAAGAWLVIAATLASATLGPVASAVSWPGAVVLSLAVVAVRGALCTFAVAGLLLDRPPTPTVAHFDLPVTVVVSARHEPRSAVAALGSLAAQDHRGPWSVVLVDRRSTDATVAEARRAAWEWGIELRVVVERRAGIAHARNTVSPASLRGWYALARAVGRVD